MTKIIEYLPQVEVQETLIKNMIKIIEDDVEYRCLKLEHSWNSDKENLKLKIQERKNIIQQAKELINDK